ncbi:MAG: nucleotidyltransferase domain-containing protein [Muribaculaceae bacterium]|nr:DNA polymerase subunit beta [Bacteroidales bacterium]MBD5303344.1 DNA polymerase subunit beta [Bacteroides sp.]MBD5340675.1 DNA polymerase subunit beta [Bacteroides sp.]MDE6071369.1 nucleotidyltransferase domain-containing protein [Muribaculaceae bacterium]
MDNRQQYIQLISNASPYIRSEFGVKSLQLFGSMARGEATDLSDIDIFVEMPPKAIKVVALKQYLQKLLGRAVDIVRSHSNIDPYLINEIQRDGITIIA